VGWGVCDANVRHDPRGDWRRDDHSAQDQRFRVELPEAGKEVEGQYAAAQLAHRLAQHT
jgi:hypothetical protein